MATTRPTMRTPPPVNPELSRLETQLELATLEELGDGVFTNVRPLFQPENARGIYGGCVRASYLCWMERQLTRYCRSSRNV